ncbi:MAG: hypothetical protein NTZ64_07670 [Polaromonas sp.]|nr:hypothetical protein [Polaromonas sp.]
MIVMPRLSLVAGWFFFCASAVAGGLNLNDNFWMIHHTTAFHGTGARIDRLHPAKIFFRNRRVAALLGWGVSFTIAA